MRIKPFSPLVCAAVVGSQFFCSMAYAQESVKAQLDSCIQKEQMLLTGKGAAVGALAGLGASLFAKKEDKKIDPLKAAALGAVVGGAAGFVRSYFTANANCLDKNPSWLPATQIERSKSFEQVRTEVAYRPAMGVLVKAKQASMPATLVAGASAEVVSTFIVMTPDGAELPVEITRKLFVTENGKEVEVGFPGRKSELRKVEPGELVDTVRVQFPDSSASGSSYRVEFSVAAEKMPPSVVSASGTVQKGTAIASTDGVR